jgi:two-component system OmpR family response regulator
MLLQRVLLVDDEPDIRRIGQLSLQAVGGLSVTLASSGAEALALVRSARPDAILLDVMMPAMDGPTCLAHLRADEATRDIPVLFVTAKVQPQEIDRYLALGAAGIIRKPFDPMTLAHDVRSLLEAAERRRTP